MKKIEQKFPPAYKKTPMEDGLKGTNVYEIKKSDWLESMFSAWWKKK